MVGFSLFLAHSFVKSLLDKETRELFSRGVISSLNANRRHQLAEPISCARAVSWGTRAGQVCGRGRRSSWVKYSDRGEMPLFRVSLIFCPWSDAVKRRTLKRIKEAPFSCHTAITSCELSLQHRLFPAAIPARGRLVASRRVDRRRDSNLPHGLPFVRLDRAVRQFSLKRRPPWRSKSGRGAGSSQRRGGSGGRPVPGSGPLWRPPRGEPCGCRVGAVLTRL